MDFNVLGTIISIASLILAFVFWYLASKQAEDASRTLNEIKDRRTTGDRLIISVA